MLNKKQNLAFQMLINDKSEKNVILEILALLKPFKDVVLTIMVEYMALLEA